MKTFWDGFEKRGNWKHTAIGAGIGGLYGGAISAAQGGDRAKAYERHATIAGHKPGSKGHAEYVNKHVKRRKAMDIVGGAGVGALAGHFGSKSIKGNKMSISEHGVVHQGGKKYYIVPRGGNA